jgi:hypothetical protein
LDGLDRTVVILPMIVSMTAPAGSMAVGPVGVGVIVLAVYGHE